MSPTSYFTQDLVGGKGLACSNTSNEEQSWDPPMPDHIVNASHSWIESAFCFYQSEYEGIHQIQPSC